MPFYRFHIDTPLPPSAVCERLRSVTREPKWFWQALRDPKPWTDPDEQPFSGKVKDRSFHIRLRHRTYHRNSFSPDIYGSIRPLYGGSRITVTIMLDPVCMAFMVLWFTAVGAFLVLAHTHHTDETSIRIPQGMLVFGVALVCVGFFPETFKARGLLEDIILV
jgi:hypothetical protein